MVVQADLVFAAFHALLGDRLPTGTRVIELLDQVEHGVHGTDVGVGAVIRAPFFVDGAGFEDAWEELVGDADAWVGLAVFQQNVIPGVVFLDEAVFQQQCILFGVHHGVADVVNLAHQHLRLEPIHLRVEI